MPYCAQCKDNSDQHRQVSALYACSNCLQAYYCSSTCQKSHWATHSSRCKRIARTIASPNGTWLEIDLKELDDDLDRRLAFERDAFTSYGRPEILLLEVLGDAEGLALVFDPKNPENVEVFGGAVVPRDDQKPDRVLTAKRVDQPAEGAFLLQFAAPPIDIPDPDTDERIGRFALNDAIVSFFDLGQGFSPPRFVSRFRIDLFDEKRDISLVHNIEAPKSQYLRRQLMSALLGAVREDATDKQLATIEQIFFKPFEGTAAMMNWSWPKIVSLIRENRELFSPDIDKRIESIDRWLADIDQVTFNVQ